MKKLYWQLLFNFQFFLFTLYGSVVNASQPEGFGGVAEELMAPVGLMADFTYSACIVVGASFLFASLIKYIEHRRSPLMVPISTPVFLLIAGLVLVLMPFLSLLSSSAVRYSLFR